jgi:hypothetical protein
MNTVPVRVANNRYILAIFDTDGLVEVILRLNEDRPLVVNGYNKALRVAKDSKHSHLLVHVTEAMPRAEYDTRLAKYKAKLALMNSPLVD